MADQMIQLRKTDLGIAIVAFVAITLVLTIGYFISSVFLITGSLFPRGEDSWKHYSTGGVFHTNSPSISPDCRNVAYSSPATGHGDIYVYDLSTKESTRITTAEDFESCPQFADGGKRIAYVRESQRRRHIWLVDPLTHRTEQITFGDVLDDISDVSSDGGQILFMRSDVTLGLGRSVKYFLLNLKDLNPKPVEIGSFATLSPSARILAYTPRGTADEIWLWDLETGRKAFVCRGDEAACSPDERFLVASRSGKQWELDREIWLVPINGAASALIGRGHSFAFTCDSAAVLFYEGYENTIWMVNIHDQSKRKIDAPLGHKTALRISSHCCSGTFTLHSSKTPKNIIFDLVNANFKCNGFEN